MRYNKTLLMVVLLIAGGAFNANLAAQKQGKKKPEDQ